MVLAKIMRPQDVRGIREIDTRRRNYALVEIRPGIVALQEIYVGANGEVSYIPCDERIRDWEWLYLEAEENPEIPPERFIGIESINVINDCFFMDDRLNDFDDFEDSDHVEITTTISI